jgi:hypothetical protein
MEEQYGVTDDYFDAVPVSDGIAIRMSDNVAAILAQLVDRLIRFLENGELDSLPGLRRGPSSDKVLQRMFPNAYRSAAESRAFRTRHAAALRDTAAARCVQARCASDTSYVINTAEVDDWVSTLGLARFLLFPRDTATTDITGTWLNYMQECLIAAINPQLVALTSTVEQPRTIRRR